MEIAEIKRALSQVSGEIPVAAFKAAMVKQDAIKPVLLEALAALTNNHRRPARASQSRLGLHALYLLTEMGSREAWTAVTELFSTMGQDENLAIGENFDEVVCDSLSQIFATLCPGDIKPLQSIIENTTIDEYVRDAALSALVVLYQQGDLVLDSLKNYLQQLFDYGLEQEKNQVWNAWVQACYNTQPDSFMLALKELYEKELADPYYITLEELNERCGLEPASICKMVMTQEGDFYCYLDDAVASLNLLSCYSGEADELLKNMENMVLNQTTPVAGHQPVAPDLHQLSSAPAANWSNVGRNDLCPCGSGKKFKKCCLH